LLAPQDTRIAFTLGIFYMEHHERAKGIAALRQCIEVDPWHEGCLNSLGYTYAEDAANLDEAEKLVQRALEIDPGNPVYTDSLGWVYFQQKKYIDALKELSYAAEKVRDPEVFDHLAQVYLKLGQKDLARKFWDASLALDPDQPAIRAWLKELDKAVP
jgi:tetratricopeptide (TPR) repeat protein